MTDDHIAPVPSEMAARGRQIAEELISEMGDKYTITMSSFRKGDGSDREPTAADVRSGDSSQAPAGQYWMPPDRVAAQQQQQVNDLRFRDHKLDLNLKRLLGYGGVSIAGAQLAVSDWTFWNYVCKSLEQGSMIAPTAMALWFSATVVEVLGIVAIIAKYLFPGTGSNWAIEPDMGSSNITDN